MKEATTHAEKQFLALQWDKDKTLKWATNFIAKETQERVLETSEGTKVGWLTIFEIAKEEKMMEGT